MRATVAWVRSWVVPPAPYVTDTKRGDNGSSRRMQAQSCCSSASVRGGKNSNDSSGGGCAAPRTGRPETRGPVSQRSSVREDASETPAARRS
jgi:hypothetical protein